MDKKRYTAMAVLANNFNVRKNIRDRMPHPYLQIHAEAWINFTLSEQPLSNFAIEADGIPAGDAGFILQDDVVRIYAGVFENNPASMRVLEKK